MNFLTRFYRFLCHLAETLEPAPPYPLCYDEWKTIEEAAEAEQQEHPETQALQNLGLEFNDKRWCIGEKSRHPSALPSETDL